MKLLQSAFNKSSNACSRLDAAAAKNMVKFRKSRHGMTEGSLSKRAKAYFWMGTSIKLAGAEKIAKLPFAAVRGVSRKLLK